MRRATEKARLQHSEDIDPVVVPTLVRSMSSKHREARLQKWCDLWQRKTVQQELRLATLPIQQLTCPTVLCIHLVTAFERKLPYIPGRGECWVRKQ